METCRYACRQDQKKSICGLQAIKRASSHLRTSVVHAPGALGMRISQRSVGARGLRSSLCDLATNQPQRTAPRLYRHAGTALQPYVTVVAIRDTSVAYIPAHFAQS